MQQTLLSAVNGNLQVDNRHIIYRVLLILIPLSRNPPKHKAAMIWLRTILHYFAEVAFLRLPISL